MYGHVPGKLHAGLTTDRFIVEWELRQPRVEAALAGTPPAESAAAAGTPIVNTELVEGIAVPRVLELPEAAMVRVEIPEDIQRIKRESMESARSWREITQRACLHYMERGHQVLGFQRDVEARRCFYVLKQP